MNSPGNSDLELFTSAVVSRLGFRVDQHNAEQVNQILQERLEQSGCQTVDAYIGRFDDPRFAQQEQHAVIQAITVPETYFFRHPEQFQALVEIALPARLEAKSAEGPLNLLSAGCATGEEAYSLAATVLRMPGHPLRKCQIWGIDLNVDLLQKARRARYSEWSLRSVDESERPHYFHRVGKEYLLKDPLKDMVRFEERNLLEGNATFWQNGFFDIIFCRNVMIYFSSVAVRRLAARLTHTLAPGGFLFLGPAETLRGISQEFHLCHTHGTFYYQRKRSDEIPPVVAEWRTQGVDKAGLPAPSDEDSSWVATIQEASFRVAALAQQSSPGSPDLTKAQTREKLFEPKALEDIRDLLKQERFEDALHAIERLPDEAATDPDALLIQAVLLTNRGEVARAEQICNQLLIHDELRPGGHYLMALCQERQGNLLSAAEQDQTAIYLDGKFAMPHLHLGLLAKRLGDLSTARRELTEALALLACEDASRILLFGGGFSREALRRTCQAQLERCGGQR